MIRYRSVWPHVSWIYLICVLSLSSLGGGYPGPCTDLSAMHLLHYVTRDVYTLPPGLELVYDEDVSAHVYRFTARARTLSFPASRLLLPRRRCDYFPEEFSILVTLRTNPATLTTRQECVFSLLPPGSTRTKLGIRLAAARNRVYVDYSDDVTGRRHHVTFRESSIFDGGWHSLVVTVTAEAAGLRVDCKPPVNKRITRRFPSYLNVREDNIHLGNCNQAEKGRFTVRIYKNFYDKNFNLERRYINMYDACTD